MDAASTMPLRADESSAPAAAVPERGSRWGRVEDIVALLCFASMVLLPLLEALLRRLFNAGIASSAALVQHCCLVLGMIGGALAAREDRLLALSTVSTFLKGRPEASARWFSHAFGAGITLVLGFAAVQFVLQERAGGQVLAYGIPKWTIELSMPLGFALIAGRLIWHAAQRASARFAAGALSGSLAALILWAPGSPQHLLWPALALLLVATVLGTPVFVVLGGAAVFLFRSRGQSLVALPIEHYQLVVNATLPTIPLFTLAGYFLAEGGASRRLVRVCDALVGHFRGGAGIAAALACAFFTSFTGASGVTILALGGLLLPVMLSARYSERHALGLLTGAGSLGLLFPPCLPLILYGIVANVRVQEMFLGGILPGALLVVLTAALGIWLAPRQTGSRRLFSCREAAAAVWEAKWELLLPVVALAAMFGGFCNTLEAAALTAFYAFVVEIFVYREWKLLREAPRVIADCALLVGGVLLILGVAIGFTDYLVDSEAPDHLMTWVQTSVHSRWVFLLALNLFLLVVGCLMDVFSAIIVVAPLVIPLGAAFGIQPVHLGIIFLANLELGFLTPPVGMNLFLSSYRFRKPMPEVVRAVVPILLVLLAGVLLITYCPVLTTWLPGLAGR